VFATAVTLVIVRAVLSQPPPFTPANFPAIPVYYVALNNAPNQQSPDQVVVGDTFTGARLATVSPPAHGTFVGVTGAADDQTFVLGAEPFPWSDKWWPLEPRTWYLLRIAPGPDHAVRLTRFRIPATPFGDDMAGMALSPDGSKFAVELLQNYSLPLGPEVLRVYSVTSGALLRSWTGARSDTSYSAYEGTDDNTTLSWLADGTMLAFDYGAGVRMLDTSQLGNDLIANSRPIVRSVWFDACSRPVVTSDGKTDVCVTGPTGGFPEGAGAFTEYSTATGKLTRTIYLSSRNTSGEVLWASPSGDALIGYLDPYGGMAFPGGSVGAITRSGFSRISFPLASGVPIPNGVAW